MAVVPRNRKSGTVYEVAIWWKGEQYWEKPLRSKREADRLNARRLREVEEGTYQPPKTRSGRATMRSYLTKWADARQNRSAKHERYLLDVLLRDEEFARLALDDARPRHFIALVNRIRASEKKPAERTITNAVRAAHTAMRDAVIEELVQANPCVLPRGFLRRGGKRKALYTSAELTLLLSGAVSIQRRVFVALAIYTGMREGEICGRRWRDWIRDSRPLTALLCETQYNDQPLKGDTGPDQETRPRVIPVHPELAALLEWWWTEGWELVYARRPGPHDWIFPTRDGRLPHSRSSGYKVWRSACDQAGIENRSLHSTRHTFITFARRGTNRADAVEAITHNAKGSMIDHYNQWLWAPLCEAMLGFRVGADVGEVHPLAVIRAPAPGLEPQPPHGNDGKARHLAKQAKAATGQNARLLSRSAADVGALQRQEGLSLGAAVLALARESVYRRALRPERLPAIVRVALEKRKGLAPTAEGRRP